MNKLYFLIFILLTGCTAHFTKPQMQLPSNFIEAKRTDGKLEDLKDYWKKFNDPLLNELMDIAFVQNFDIQTEIARIAQVRALYQEARSKLFPTINLIGDAIREQISPNTLPKLSQAGALLLFNLFRLGFDSIWEVDIFGKNRFLKDAAYADLEAEIEQARFVRITTIAEVARIYVEIRNIQQQISLSNESLKSQSIISNLIGERYDSGLTNDQEVMSATSSEDDIKVEIASLERDLKQSIFQLATLLGQTPECLNSKFSEIGDIPIAASKIPPLLPSEVVRRRPDIRRAEKTLEAAYIRTRAAIASFFPTFNLLGQAHKESLHLNNLFDKKSNAWLIEGNFSLTLIDFGNRRAQLNFADAVEKEAYIQYEKTVIDALSEVESSLIAYFKEDERNSSYLDKKNQAEQTKMLEEDLYRSGLTDFATLLAFYQSYYTSKRLYLTSQRDLMLNLISVYLALGGGI